MDIVVFVPNWIGDVVMATPAFRALRNHFGDARITGVMKPYVGDVLAGNPWFDEEVHLTKSSAGLIVKGLRQRGTEMAVLLTNSFRSAWVAKRGRCRRIWGYARDWRSWLLTDKLQPLREGRRFVPSPVIDYYLDLVYALGCPKESYRMELWTSAEDEAAADRVWESFGWDNDTPVVTVNTGGAFGAAKQWPLKYFAEFTREAAKELNARVLVLCGPNERESAREIVEAANSDAVKSLAELELSIGLSKAAIRRSQVLVTTDSGPRHFATAFDKPTVSLFGPTHIEWTETYHDKAVHLQEKVDCGPCQMKVCPLDHRCMTRLTPEKVLTATRQLWQHHVRLPKS